MQLAVPHPEAQQDAVDVVLGGRLWRKDSKSLSLTFTITQITGTEVFLLRLLRLLTYLPAHQDGRCGVRCDGQNSRRSIWRCDHKQKTQLEAEARM